MPKVGYVPDFSTYLFYRLSLLPAGTEGFTLTTLAVFDKNALPSAQQLGADVLRSIQELQLEHWGSSEVGILSDDTVQELILGANKLLDLSLSMEKTVLDIRQSALRTYNIALGGQAYGRMLQILEDIFGYNEPPESVRHGETPTPDPSDSDPKTEEGPVSGIPPPLAPKPSASSSKTAGEQAIIQHCPTLKHRGSPFHEIPAGKGKAKAAKKDISLPLSEAVAFYVISEKAITMKGISASDLLLGKALKPASKKKKQSIYRCQHCGYLTKQKS